MVRIAHVDDNDQDRSTIYQYVDRFNSESETKIQLTAFSNPYTFLEQYDGSYDILILDIEMTPFTGIELADEIRKVDSSVVILFLTNMAQYAINGYAVFAIDYILKPLQYFEFQMKIKRAFRFIDNHRKEKYVIHVAGKSLVIEIDSINYIEVLGNNCLFHTTQGDHEVRSTLKEIESKLKGHDFIRVNYSYLVNMKYVQEIKDMTAVVAGENLQISRTRKKEFLNAQLRYWAGERNFL